MQNQEKQLMQQTSKWTVIVGKEKFVLNDKQINFLKEATKKGIKGLVWYKEFAISIPHISSISKVGGNIPIKPPELPKMSEKQVETNFKRLKQMKDKLLNEI